MTRLEFTCLKPECGYEWPEYLRWGMDIDASECPACRAGGIDVLEEQIASRADYNRREDAAMADYYHEKYGD